MSGGVDSTATAGLLKQRGYEVVGVHARLGYGGRDSIDHVADARKMADKLGIELHVVDLTKEFKPIIDNFISEYKAGRTPNPCIHCNKRIKFGKLLEFADKVEARYLATGHYARISRFSSQPAIVRGLSRAKDQSYALFQIPAESLGRILLPLGEFAGKDEVRAIAQEFGLEVHNKPDSQEVCFIPNDDYVSLLKHHAPDALQAGDIVDHQGNVLGQHDGYAKYTIGQRRGLGVAAGIPMYVTKIDPANATVRIGTREQTMGSYLKAHRANWHAPVRGTLAATVQIRYNHRGAPARVTITGPDTFEVEFVEPVHAITPGQAAVVYDGDRLVGGGWIL